MRHFQSPWTPGLLYRISLSSLPIPIAILRIGLRPFAVRVGQATWTGRGAINASRRRRATKGRKKRDPHRLSSDRAFELTPRASSFATRLSPRMNTLKNRSGVTAYGFCHAFCTRHSEQAGVQSLPLKASRWAPNPAPIFGMLASAEAESGSAGTHPDVE
jgi:hypothetical protein